MGALPLPGGIFVGLGQRGIGVHGAQNLVQAQPVLHGQHKLRQQIARVFTDDGHAQNAVFAGHGQHLDKAIRSAVSNGAVQVVDAVLGDFIGNVLLLGVLLVESHARHLRLNESGDRHHPIVHLELPESAKQCVHNRVPGHMGSGVGQLVGAGHVTCCIDIGVQRLQVVVHRHRALRRNTQRFQTIPLQAGDTSHGTQQGVKLDALFSPLVLNDDECA